jgi:hypothetical protein
LGWKVALGRTFSVALDYAFAWERAASFGYTHLISLSVRFQPMPTESVDE